MKKTVVVTLRIEIAFDEYKTPAKNRKAIKQIERAFQDRVEDALALYVEDGVEDRTYLRAISCGTTEAQDTKSKYTK